MKLSFIIAAAFATLAVAAPAPEPEAIVPEHSTELEARQGPPSNVNQPCRAPYVPGDYVCFYDPANRRHWIGACQINNRWVFIAWCPGVCLNRPGYPVCT